MRRIPVPPGFLDGLSAGEARALPDEAGHYAAIVLRLQAGEKLELFDGEGLLARAILTSVDPPSIEVEESRRTEEGESPLSTILFQAIPKGKRWDTILEKATELGVTKIVPLQTDRTVVAVPSGKANAKLQRWEKITTAAARQCRRSRVPSIALPMTVEEALEKHHAGRHLLAHTEGESRASLLEAFSAPSSSSEPKEAESADVGIWIGPEGGFTAAEVGLLRDRGARAFHLGPRILRADTAGIVTLGILQFLGGDFR